MRSHFKSSSLLTVTILIISFIYAIFDKNTATLLSFINSLFIIGGIIFLLGLFRLVVDAGFFNTLVKSSRKMMTSLGIGRPYDEEEKESKPYWFTKPFIISGFVCILISFVLSIIFY